MLNGGGNHWNDEEFLPNQRDPKVQADLKAGRVRHIGKEGYYKNGKPVERAAGIYSNDLFTSKLMSSIEEGRRQGQTLFAYLPFTTAHYLKLGWDGLDDNRLQRMQKAGVAPADATLPAANLIAKHRWDALTPEQQKTQARLMATFAAMADNQDQSIGQLLDYLKSTKQLVNRLIIDLSDNDPEAFDG